MIATMWAGVKRCLQISVLLLAVCAALLIARSDIYAKAKATPITNTAEGNTAAASGCSTNWEPVSTPNFRTHQYLRDIDALAPDDIWAVGEYHDENNYTPDTAYTMRWNGVQWAVIPTPPIPGGAELNGVDAISPNDVWAVGHCPSCGMTSLALHWDGVQWSRVDTPDPPGFITLYDVVALAPNNVWAVGANDGLHSTVVMNWDGNAWSIVPSPNGGGFGDDNVLTSVTAVSSTDIWAVGYIYPKGGTPTTLAIHWNGSQWTLVTTPNPGNYFRSLYGVSALAPNDVWAVGMYSSNSGETYLPLFLHWNGSVWVHVPSPEFGDYNVLNAVYAIAPNDVWAVGTSAACNFCFFETLTMHWDGTQWSRHDSPNGFRDLNRLYGVVATSSENVWAVGSTAQYAYPYYSDALAMHRFCLSPTPTGTPPTATPTRTNVPTYTPTPTRTTAATPTCNPAGLRILIVYADYSSPPSALRNGILAQPGVQTVDYFRADSITPNLQQLLQYDVVVALANLTVYADPVSLGDRLADYEDAHGIVVAFDHSWDGTLREIQGRWQSGGYSPFRRYAQHVYDDATLGSHNAQHPVMQGVTNLSAFYRLNVVLMPGAEQIATWSDGLPLVALNGRAVGVNAYVGDADGGWSGDFGRIVVNAGLWLRPNACGTPGATQTPASPTATAATRTVTATRTASATSTPGRPPSCTVPSFGGPASFVVGNAPERGAAADFNEDGNTDLAVANHDSASLSVLLGDGSGAFQPAVDYELPAVPGGGIGVADFNLDGHLDLVASGNGVNMAMILPGNGTGTFGDARRYGSGSNSSGLAVSDFNRDGRPDIVVADDGHDTMLVLINNGSGGFGAGTPYDVGWMPSDIAVGDFNRDGNIDVITSNSLDDNVSVRLGNGSGSFGPVQNYDVSSHPIGITVGDLNLDGNPDFATSSGESGNISVRLGNGAGGFGLIASYPATNGSISIGQADFNGDGISDFAVATTPGRVGVLLGNGTGGFGPMHIFGAGRSP